jgi:hypothetical protein
MGLKSGQRYAPISSANNSQLLPRWRGKLTEAESVVTSEKFAETKRRGLRFCWYQDHSSHQPPSKALP